MSQIGHNRKLGTLRLILYFCFSVIERVNHVIAGVIQHIGRNSQEKDSESNNEPMRFAHEEILYVYSKSFSVVCPVVNFTVF